MFINFWRKIFYFLSLKSQDIYLEGFLYIATNYGPCTKLLRVGIDFRLGFAMLEYEKFEEAQAAILVMNGAELLTQIISLD
ncbi:hypothetical protein Sjap_016238 [Stephania japonica]|uniref:RRM domain-containing protein n=1 Tax=Stephania japonica TaxID=461633 RepID=A0AAP0IKN6_9MAGN